MTSPFSFELVLAFAYMGACLWLGIFLRAKIKFFQYYLVPGSLLGGAIGLILFNCGLVKVAPETFQTIAYHLFIISFISIGLTGISKDSSSTPKEVARGTLWLGLQNTLSMSTQSMIGIAFVLACGAVGYAIHPFFGYFLPLGYTQGPGQALTFAKLWEVHANFPNAVNLGLTFASLGFVFAFCFGVPLAYWGLRKGYTFGGKREIPPSVRRGFYLQNEECSLTGTLPIHSGNVDSLAFSCAAIGVVYGITYACYYLVNIAWPPITTGWGFFFTWALFVAFGLRFILKKSKIEHCLDTGLQRRLSGWAVDFLTIATLLPIQLTIVADYIVPISILAIIGALWTLGQAIYFGRRLSPLGFERMLGIFGANTGTMASGLLLLRVIDPDFKTSASAECGAYVLIATPGITACFVLLAYSAKWGWSMWQTFGAFAGISLICLILLKLFGLWKKLDTPFGCAKNGMPNSVVNSDKE